MTDLAYYLSFAVTLLACPALFLVIRRRIGSSRISEANGKNLYSFCAPFIGLLSGLVLFPATVSIFRAFGAAASYGHGEVLVAAPVFNLLLASVLAVIGRVVLGWRRISW